MLTVNKRWRIPKGQLKMYNLENTEGAIKNGQSREISNIVYTRRRKIQQRHNTKCVGNNYV